MEKLYYYTIGIMKKIDFHAIAKTKLKRLFFVSILACTGFVYGQSDALHLSPQDAVDLAIRNNLSLASNRIGLDTRQRKADFFWNQFLPSVSFSGTMSRSNWATTQPGFSLPGVMFGSPIDIVLSEPYTIPQWSFTGSVNASLDFSFALLEGIKSIRMDYQSGILGLDKAQLQMERDVRKMYNQILLLEENAALLKGSFENTERQAATAEANFRAGLAPRLTLLQAQVAVSNMRPNIDEMENSLQALKGSFAMNLGLSYDTPFELAPFTVGDFDIPLDLAELITRSVSQKPDIIELRQNIATLNSNRKAQALQMYTPFLRFSWGANYTLMDPFNVSWSDEWNKSGSFSVTLGFSLNSLLPFTKEGQAIKDLDNRVSELNLALAQLVMGTELEIFTKLSSLEKTLMTEEAQRASVDLAQLSYDLTYEAYRAGLQDFQTVQSAELALRQAQLQLLTQQFNYMNDLIDLEYAVGVPFGTLSGR